MDLTDLQKLDLKLTARTDLLLETCEDMTNALERSSKTLTIQGELNSLLTQKVINLSRRLETLEGD